MSAHLDLVIGAWLLDLTLGDPVYRLHPIRLLGAWSLLVERWLFAAGRNGRGGGLLHLLLIVGGALAAWSLVHAALSAITPGLALLWDLYLAYSLLCLRDLFEQGWRILLALDDLPAARARLACLVGRDTAPLGRDGVVRATIESLSENLTDAVLTPLWALCLFGLPGLILVKSISTLDSMVGYRTARYRLFGWAAARSDDWLHWLPARLSVPLIATAAVPLRLHPLLALGAAWRWHALLASPNSGWSEAAFAGALRVRLIGPIWRDGRLVNARFMGAPDWPADLGAADLRRALALLLLCGVLALGVGLLLTPYRALWPW